MAESKKEFLDALGRRDVELDLTPDEIAHLRRSMKQLASTARLAHTAADRPTETSFDEPLALELMAAIEDVAFGLLERTQLSKVLDENGQLVFRDLEVGDVPAEDIQFLTDCGVKSPRDEIVIAVTRLKAGYWPVDNEGRSRIGTENIVEISRKEIYKVASALAGGDDATRANVAPLGEPKKRRKIFNGIGRILSGVVAGTGNVLIGTGAIPATGGAAIAGVIASAAVSVGLIMQGIGDLRGE